MMHKINFHVAKAREMCNVQVMGSAGYRAGHKSLG